MCNTHSVKKMTLNVITHIHTQILISPLSPFLSFIIIQTNRVIEVTLFLFPTKWPIRGRISLGLHINILFSLPFSSYSISLLLFSINCTFFSLHLLISLLLLVHHFIFILFLSSIISFFVYHSLLVAFLLGWQGIAGLIYDLYGSILFGSCISILLRGLLLSSWLGISRLLNAHGVIIGHLHTGRWDFCKSETDVGLGCFALEWDLLHDDA